MKQRIGTDVSLDVCRAEGYLTVIATSKQDFSAIDPNKDFVFGRTLPGHCPQFRKYYTGCHSANDVWEMYERHKSSIDPMYGVSFDFPANIYDLLQLADAVDDYTGEII